MSELVKSMVRTILIYSGEQRTEKLLNCFSGKRTEDYRTDGWTQESTAGSFCQAWKLITPTPNTLDDAYTCIYWKWLVRCTNFNYAGVEIFWLKLLMGRFLVFGWTIKLSIPAHSQKTTNSFGWKRMNLTKTILARYTVLFGRRTHSFVFVTWGAFSTRSGTWL